MAQARGARLASGFGRFKRPEAQFSSQKFTTAPIYLGLAPVFAPRARFLSSFRYRSVEEDVTNAGEVGCMQGGPWHARELLGIFLTPLPL